jgi:UPF0755 protein
MILKRKGKKKKIYVIVIVALLIITGGIIALHKYREVFEPNVVLPKEKVGIEIPTGADFEQVKRIFFNEGILKDTSSFVFTAEKMNYPNQIHPGHYIISRGMNNREIITMLRAGLQSPVKVTFTSTRDLRKIAGKVDKQIEADSTSIMNRLLDEDFIDSLGFNRYTIPALFIPNTYEFYWNTGATEFLFRMKAEYQKFWDDSRRSRASEIGLTPVEVSTLASIVKEETRKNDELAKIAGVYLNRLERGMLLQADPTVKFANNDFTLGRVLNRHLEINSPYNTYKYPGLPPGPIVVPTISAIDAVLNHEDHEYFYFCARDDFSGYHNFAKTLSQHLQNARSYQKALNRRKILK